MALKLFARFDQAEALACIDPERLEHRGRQHLAHAALERQAAVAHARPGRAARPLGAEVEQAAIDVFELREEEAAAVAEIGIVGLELVAVIAQRQRGLEAAGDRHEAAEMIYPFGFAQPIEPDALCCPLVAIAQDVLAGTEPAGRHRRIRHRGRGGR